MDPPTFQEAPRCDVCKCSFNAFRRRHHCRSCGRTLCHEHSSSQLALPQFGLYTPVRVCSECYNGSSGAAKSGVQASSDGTGSATASFSTLGIGGDADSTSKPTMQAQPASAVLECKCGMPLCICEAPVPAVEAPPIQIKSTPAPLPQSPKVKKPETVVKPKPSTSNSKPGSVFNLGQANNGMPKKKADYEVNGEGMREAIKCGDLDAVKKLLSEGVDANYHDRQGLSLLHLAAVFNQTEIVFTLMDSGASLDYKNAQGETPLDCAPVTLQYKMRQKMEEDRRM